MLKIFKGILLAGGSVAPYVAAKAVEQMKGKENEPETKS